MNTDDIKFKLEELWTRFQNWFNATWFKIQTYFKALDMYEYIGWGVNGVALILVILAFII